MTAIRACARGYRDHVGEPRDEDAGGDRELSLEAIEAIRARMAERAQELGAAVIEAERALDGLFKERSLDAKDGALGAGLSGRSPGQCRRDGTSGSGLALREPRRGLAFGLKLELPLEEINGVTVAVTLFEQDKSAFNLNNLAARA